VLNDAFGSRKETSVGPLWKKAMNIHVLVALAIFFI
jgi:hypothetical protein